MILQTLMDQLETEAVVQEVSLGEAFKRAGLNRSTLSRARRRETQLTLETAELVDEQIGELVRNARRRAARSNGA